MGSSDSPPSIAIDDLREFFSQLGQPTTPVSLEEVTESLNCTPQTAHRYLEELTERDEIRTKRINGTVRVWWATEEGSIDRQAPDSEQFRAFVKAVKDYAIFMLEPDGTVASWNQGAERIKGYSEDEIVGEHFSTFYTEDDNENDIPKMNLETAVTKGRVEDEGWRVRRDGSQFWANVVITAIHNADGSLQGFTKVTQDMTERRENEQQLEEQAERLERQRDELEQELDDIFERIDDAFYALDDELRYEYVNEHAEAYLGESTGDLIGQKPWQVLDADESDPIFDRFEEALKTQEPIRFERYSKPLDIWAMVRAYPSDSGLSVYFEDITQRKERERELERVHDLLERAERIADIGGWEIDPDTRDVFWTEHLFDILAVGSDEEPSLNEVLDVYHDEDQRTVERAVEAGLRSGKSFDIESRFQTSSGEVRWLRILGDPDVKEGEVVSLRGAVQDITEQKAFERELQESNERLEQFAYAASHDLQEPLRMVSSYLQLLEDRYGDELDSDGREFIEFAVNGADRMREMIEALLEYSRIETAGSSFEPVNLDLVLEDVLADIQFQVAEQDAEILCEELPTVEGDSSQLRQVFQNLLENAIEYSGDTPPRVHITTERAGGEWIISVSDEGIGIDPENQDRIFEIFHRLHPRDEHAGTGIGLTLCKRIVERHGGSIWVDSGPDDGATFSFSLPATDKSE